jgi:hypothetical protein
MRPIREFRSTTPQLTGVVARCDNCCKLWSERDVVPARDLARRHDEGFNIDLVAGECADCSALCYYEGLAQASCSQGSLGAWEFRAAAQSRKEFMVRAKIKSYIEAGGTHCPYCQSCKLDTGVCDLRNRPLVVEVICMACGERWRNQYRLVGVLLPGEVRQSYPGRVSSWSVMPNMNSEDDDRDQT